MESLDPQTLGLFAIISGLGFAMVWVATRMNALEHRQESKCPACGVIRRNGSCSCSD